jgi:hypothetical protein
MSVPTRENAEARIKKLRDRAEEIRTDAVKIRQERIRASMLNIASSYDRVADSLAPSWLEKTRTPARLFGCFSSAAPCHRA